MGETRVDLQHLLEDLRDAYSGAVEQTILTEIVANALDSGATPELVGRGGGAGVLVAEGDAGLLAAAIGQLLDDPERRARMGRAARERIAREFPLARMENAYVRLFEAASAGRPSR